MLSRFTMLGDDPPKNVEGLIHAYGMLPGDLTRRHLLVIGGRYCDAAIDGLLRCVAGPMADRIVFTKTVGDPCLRALYSTCSVFVFPSRYKGFGLPVAEALACGSVAIASNRSVLPELIEDPDALFDPDNPEDIAACIARALSDQALRQRCREQAVEKRQSRSWNQIAAKSINELLRFE